MPCQAQRVPKMASLYSHRLRCLRLSSNRSPVQQFAPVGWMSSTCFSTKLPPQSCRENFYVSVGSLSFSASPGAALWPASFPGSSTTGLHERKSSDPSSPHLLRSAQQKRWSRVSSRRAADVPGPKKSSGVRVRKHSQQKFNNEPEAKQQDWQQNQASGAPPPQQQGGNQVAPAPNAPAPSLQQKGAGMMGVIAEGMMHGVGWAFGQRAVDALMGPRTMEVVHTDSSGGAPPDLSSSSAPSSPTFDGSQAPLSSTGSSGPADTNAYGPEGWQWGNDESSHGGGDDDGGGWFGGGDGDW